MKKGKVETCGGHTFDEVLRGHNPEVRQIAWLARDLILSTLPKMTEVPWPRDGTVGCGVGPKKMSEHFCYVAPQKAHVNVGFFYGVDLPDPKGLLEGTGKRLRHVKLRTAADVRNPVLVALVRKASRHLPKLSG